MNRLYHVIDFHHIGLVDHWYFPSYIRSGFVSSCKSRLLVKMNPKDTAFRKDKTKLEIISETSLYMLTVIMAQGLKKETKAYNSKKKIIIIRIFIIGGSIRAKCFSFRLAAATWCLIALVLVYGYNSQLISYVSVPKYYPVINTWDDLEKSETLSIASERGAIVRDIILVTF